MNKNDRYLTLNFECNIDPCLITAVMGIPIAGFMIWFCPVHYEDRRNLGIERLKEPLRTQLLDIEQKLKDKEVTGDTLAGA